MLVLISWPHWLSMQSCEFIEVVWQLVWLNQRKALSIGDQIIAIPVLKWKTKLSMQIRSQGSCHCHTVLPLDSKIMYSISKLWLICLGNTLYYMKKIRHGPLFPDHIGNRYLTQCLVYSWH